MIRIIIAIERIIQPSTWLLKKIVLPDVNSIENKKRIGLVIPPIENLAGSKSKLVILLFYNKYLPDPFSL